MYSGWSLQNTYLLKKKKKLKKRKHNMAYEVMSPE